MSAPYQTQYPASQQQPQYIPPQAGQSQYLPPQQQQQPHAQQQVYYAGAPPQYANNQQPPQYAPTQVYYQQQPQQQQQQQQVVYQQPQQPIVYPAAAPHHQQQHQQQQQQQQQQHVQYQQPQQQPLVQNSYVPPSSSADHQFVQPSKTPLVNSSGPNSYGGVPTPLSDEGDENGRLAKASKCRDGVWAFLFIAHVIGMFVLSMYLWKIYKDDMNTSNSDTYHGDVNQPKSDFKLSKHAWELLGIVVAVAFLCSCLWLYLFKKYATCLIWTCLILNSALLFFLTIWAFYIGVIFMGIIFGLFFLLSLLYMYVVRDRIAFSSEILRLTVVVIQQYSNLVIPAYSAIFLQVGWLFVWTIAAACSMHGLRKKGESDSSVGIVWFFLLISLYWTAQVIKVSAQQKQ